METVAAEPAAAPSLWRSGEPCGKQPESERRAAVAGRRVEPPPVGRGGAEGYEGRPRRLWFAAAARLGAWIGTG